jgi:ATP synthase protein I
MEDTPQSKHAEPSLKSKERQVIGRYGTIGLEIFFSILLGYVFGSYLDEWLGTKPYLTLLLTVYGLVAAARALTRLTKMYQEDLKAQDQASNHGRDADQQ